MKGSAPTCEIPNLCRGQMNKIVKMFGDDDPRIDALHQEIKAKIYERGVGVFQVSTIIGILQILQWEIMREANDD